MREDLTWLLGEEWYTEHNESGFEMQKKHTIKAFLVIQRWSKISMNESFIFVTRVTQLIHDVGKYLLISVYPLPTHPTHNFTHKKGGNLDTLPDRPRPILTQGTLVP